MKKFDLEKVSNVAKVVYYTTMVVSSIVGIGVWLWWWKDCKKSIKEVLERVPEDDFEDGEFIVNPNLNRGEWDDSPYISYEDALIEWVDKLENESDEIPVDNIIKDFEKKLSEEIDNLSEDDEAALDQGVIHSKKWDDEKNLLNKVDDVDDDEDDGYFLTKIDNAIYREKQKAADKGFTPFDE